MLSLWVIFAVLTSLAIFSVLWPLSRAPLPLDGTERDVAFYRAQAVEIDRDASRGLIQQEEALVARAEAARRLMGAAGRARALPLRTSPFAVRIVSLGALLFVPAVALAVYARVGTPDLPDMPLEARLQTAPGQMDLPTAVAKIERHLAEAPGDGRGYDVLAPTYLRLGRADDAARAYAKAVALLGASADRYAGLGEAQVFSGNGVVTAAAKTSFERAAALDPASPRAAYYLGLAAQQDGDKAKALAIWRRLAASSPSHAPWSSALAARIAEASGAPAPQPVASASADGPPGGLAAAIRSMPADQRQAAIQGMVDRLADRLKSDGGDLDGWLRLVRAYRVLDDTGKARAALADARRRLASDAAATKRLDALADELGLQG